MQKQKYDYIKSYIRKKEYKKAERLLSTMLDDEKALTMYLQLQQVIESHKANSSTSWQNNRVPALILAIILFIVIFTLLRAI